MPTYRRKDVGTSTLVSPIAAESVLTRCRAILALKNGISSMQVTLMKGKIHRAHVTEADLHYEGSISIDRTLIEAAGFLLNERVDIYNIDTGARFSTYVIEAAAGSGIIGLNGAAARLAMAGDKASSSPARISATLKRAAFNRASSSSTSGIRSSRR